MFSPPIYPTIREVDSLSSDPESPAFNKVSKDNSSDFELSSKAYVDGLLECGLKEERFRIDRKKLEDMLQTQQSSNPLIENAEVFFQRVMLETATQISWPSKLKIGAKSKKDPHVKIVGKPEAVQLAKEKILSILDTKKNRVTLKMDVSHSDHSYIIGKGGFKIQQVMEETGCHIHFPDSNRNSTAEKSNQVSIAGQASGVELARAKIRDLLPLVFTFELPIGPEMNGELCSPAVQHIQQTYSFNVTFRHDGEGRTLLEVRGCQRLLSRLRQGLALLMEYLIGSKTIPVLGVMKTEIAAQHHQFVMGPGNVNLQMIVNKTGATLIFPDAIRGDPEVWCPKSQSSLFADIQSRALISGPRSKSTVIIKGSFDSVCLAWQELLKCLPLVLMFDLKEGQELDPIMVNNFMEAFNINIVVRPKMKENTKSVLIRGAEKDSQVLFQVRKEILCLDEDDLCPSSPSITHTRLPTVDTFGGNHDRLRPVNAKPGLSTAESLSLLTNIFKQNPQIVGLLNNLSTAFPQNVPEVSPHQAYNPLYKHMLPKMQNPQIQMNHFSGKPGENWSNRQDRGYAFSSGVNVSNFLQKDRQLPLDDGDSDIFSPSSSSSGFDTKSELSGSSRPLSSASSTSSNDTPDYNKATSFFNKQPSESDGDVHHLLADYGNKKLTASKAMQQSIDGVRTPTPVWSGYGFSKSMPDFSARAKLSTSASGSISEYLEADNSNISNVEAAAAKAWNTEIPEKSDSPLEQVPSPFALSNFWENVRRQTPINYNAIDNLFQLLRVLDLEKYNDVFAHHEINLEFFLSLTEGDLQKLDIGYVARRKMLSAISAIREQRALKQFRAAPGAERRTFFSSRFSEKSDRM